MTKWSLTIAALACFLVAGLLVSFSRAYIVPTASMRPTLIPGDIVWCIGALRIRRADVVVFDVPNSRERGIKRVVGLPGDRVIYQDKTLTINNRLASKIVKERLPIDDPMDLLLEQTLRNRTFDIVELYGPSLTRAEPVPASLGYYLMGDNRDDSQDSRNFGAVPSRDVRCRAVAILATERNGAIDFRRARGL